MSIIIIALLLQQQCDASPADPLTGSDQALSAPRSWHLFRCISGDGRPNAAIDCITTFEQLRQETRSPQNFGARLWTDGSEGCQVTARRSIDERATIVVPDTLDDLFYLLYRCFFAARATPSQAGSIRTGVSLSYALTLSPPRVSPRDSGLMTLDNGLSDRRAYTQCRLRPGGPSNGKYTDCLPILLGWLNAPGSAEPREWKLDDPRHWSTPGCFVSLSYSGFSRTLDRFPERSLIDDAVWIMGKCFAGPQAARRLDEGWMQVGPRKMWTLRVMLGNAPWLLGTGNNTNQASE
ncbi:MAG: hypothetical protein Q9216_003273 [Gyalolechia sp. 2 TL-2023]